MDLTNYAMHLTTSELEYELNIRGIFNLSTQRLRTSALREQLSKENAGLQVAPKRSDIFKAVDELKQCKLIFENITESLINSKNHYELSRCVSRLYHIESRLERIIPEDKTTESDIAALADCVYDALIQACDCINKSESASQANANALASSTISDQVRKSLNAIEKPRVSNVDEFQKSLRAFSDKINSINFNNEVDVEGAVGTDKNATLRERESLIDLDSLTPTERNDVANIIGDYVDINPFRHPKSPVANAFLPNPSFRSVIQNQNNCGPTRQLVNDDYGSSRENRQFSRPNLQQANIPSREFQVNNQGSYSFHSRKSVPISQWRISFSGERDGLHLYDFLSQIALFQRSEKVTDTEMMYSIIHLLTGRARLWFMSVYEQFRDWSQVITEMKREFLPANYDYLLFTDINNRRQKEQETFSEFLTHMQAMFKCLSIPIVESHKLYIVQRNLLPRYAMAIAPLELRSLYELSEACRRIDNATLHANRVSFSVPFNNIRPEVCAVQQQFNNRNSSQSVPNVPRRNVYNKCWNCQAIGHSHRECQAPKNGIFCFGCGARGIIASDCDRCRGNGSGNLAAGGPAPNSEPQN